MTSASWSDFSKMEATMGIEKCLAERDEEKMSKGEKSSLRVDKGKEKEISEEARAKSYFSQRSYWFDD